MSTDPAMQIDLSVIEDGEFMVAQVEAHNDRAAEFLDAYCPEHEYTAVDSGRIIVSQADLHALLTAARHIGLETSRVQS